MLTDAESSVSSHRTDRSGNVYGWGKREPQGATRSRFGREGATKKKKKKVLDKPRKWEVKNPAKPKPVNVNVPQEKCQTEGEKKEKRQGLFPWFRHLLVSIPHISIGHTRYLLSGAVQMGGLAEFRGVGTSRSEMHAVT